MTFLETMNSSDKLFVKQRKEWFEIVSNFETKNVYEVFDSEARSIVFFREQPGGLSNILARLITRSHRGFKIDALLADRTVVLQLRRKFFFFFSDLEILNNRGMRVGSVHRRFSFFSKKYELKNEKWQVFATISSPLWRFWTFPITPTTSLGSGASIAKKWTGGISEFFTDADTFLIDYGSIPWSLPERATILAAAISIDFDFFENNQGNS